jgi:Abortive infection C-terminus
MKTICANKGWPFDKGADGCKKLVDTCSVNRLFPEFYANVLIATGTIRNKMGDAHGRGPTPQYSVTKEHAGHMIRLVSTHVTLLVDLAGL